MLPMIDHIHITVEDIDRAERFYIKNKNRQESGRLPAASCLFCCLLHPARRASASGFCLFCAAARFGGAREQRL